AARTLIVRAVCQNFLGAQEKSARKNPSREKNVDKESVAVHTAICGAEVRAGRRQSIPSGSIESCAGVSETVPLVAGGQMKRPRSSLLAKRHSPSPSHQSTLIRSPRRPRNTNTCPENGFSASAVCTMPLSPTNPRRRSVTPATIQILVPAGGPIIPPTPPAPRAAPPDPPSL